MYLDCTMISWMDPMNTKPDTDEEKNWSVAPTSRTTTTFRLWVSFPMLLVLGAMASSVHVRLVYTLAVACNRYTKPSFWERSDECSKNGKNALVRQRTTWNGVAYLIAPAAMDGPNHCPTSVPSSLPARAIRCTLKGASSAGVSRNQVMISTYVAYSAVCTGCGGTRNSIPSYTSVRVCQ